MITATAGNPDQAESIGMGSLRKCRKNVSMNAGMNAGTTVIMMTAIAVAMLIKTLSNYTASNTMITL